MNGWQDGNGQGTEPGSQVYNPAQEFISAGAAHSGWASLEPGLPDSQAGAGGGEGG